MGCLLVWAISSHFIFIIKNHPVDQTVIGNVSNGKGLKPVTVTIFSVVRNVFMILQNFRKFIILARPTKLTNIFYHSQLFLEELDRRRKTLSDLLLSLLMNCKFSFKFIESYLFSYWFFHFLMLTLRKIWRDKKLPISLLVSEDELLSLIIFLISLFSVYLLKMKNI